MTIPAEIAADTVEGALGAFDFATLIPLGAFVGLIGVLVTAAWAARSALVLRLYETQRGHNERFAQFQREAVATIHELSLSMARYIEQTSALDAAVKQALQQAPPRRDLCHWRSRPGVGRTSEPRD